MHILILSILLYAEITATSHQGWPDGLGLHIGLYSILPYTSKQRLNIQDLSSLGLVPVEK